MTVDHAENQKKNIKALVSLVLTRRHIIWKTLDGEEFKLSSKGVQKRRNTLTPQDLVNTLSTQVPAGLIQDKEGCYTYLNSREAGNFLFLL